ncbi:MAG: protein translocase subunit SecD [Phycisphaerales bacterium]
MRHLVRKSILVLAITLIAILAIIPPSKTLKKGRDLAGGVVFVYQVDVGSDVQSRQAVMDGVKNVVKDRLDPNGVLDISVVQVGADRLEISMPLPSPEVRARFNAFEDALGKLGRSSIDPVLFDRLVALPQADREAEFRKLIGDDETRWKAVRAAFDAHAKWQATQAPLDEAERELAEAKKKLSEADPALPDEFKKLLEQGVVAAEQKVSAAVDPWLDAEKEYKTAKTAALSAGVSIAEMQRILRLRTDELKVRDPKNLKEVIDTIPSVRADAIKDLKERHAGSAAQIDRVVTLWDEYSNNRTTLNDPSDLIRLLKGAGVLNFRITVAPGELSNEQDLRRQLRTFGPLGTRADQARWYKINKIDNWYNEKNLREDVAFLKADPAGFFRARGYVGEELDGEYYLLCWDTRDKRLTERDGRKWSLVRAYQDRDEIGRPAIAFQMDAVGGDMLGELTGQNIKRYMAVLLDDEIYTAPVLNGRITTRGTIEGGSSGFSPAELNYIIKVLSHGSLQGKLGKEPISQQVVAAEAGADNLRKGLKAGMIAFVVCAGFMVVYYFGCGLISVLALVMNALFVVAAMAIQNAPFTLPGIAGVVLVFGMAVDANVLIYERMREEIERGSDLKTAVRLGYSKALASIVDGNITTLIACVVLGFTGTQEVKGFAITLGLGNVMTLFTQLFVTRIIFAWLVERRGMWRKTSMLPLAIPALGRALHPNVDWMRFRYGFLAVSLALTVGSIVVMVVQGREMLGSEFRGGTKVTIRLAPDKSGNPREMTRAEVEKIIDDAADKADAEETLRSLKTADIVVINPGPDGIRSSEFAIKTTDTRAKEVQAAVTGALSGVIDAQPALDFKGADAPATSAPIFPIVEPDLGKAIKQPSVHDSLPTFVGGAAIVLDNISPPVSLESIQQRLSSFRRQPDFQGISSREQQVVLLRGTPDAVESVAVVVKDPAVSIIDNRDRWTREVQDREWDLVQAALRQSTTLSNVESFSPQIASTFRAQAVIAVLLSSVLVVIYVWVRFGSLRYSLAAITTTLHDCLVAIGAIAVIEIIHKAAPGPVESLGLQPFKLDLNLVAAVLTILGYSLNDTIIVMDRIRETKGKLDHANRRIINESINKTISRTLITSGTTFLACAVLYVFGGDAVRGFAYAMLVGILAGTYSSIAVAAPLVWSEHHETATRTVHGA